MASPSTSTHRNSNISDNYNMSDESNDSELVIDCKENVDYSDFKLIFYKTLVEYHEQHQGSQKKPWTEERVIEVINEIKMGTETLNSGLRRTSMEYYWMNKYEIMTIGNQDHLIFKKGNTEDQPVRILPREQYFDILLDIHKFCKHGGRDKMLNYIKNKYYIPKKAVEIFVSHCPKCHSKRNILNKHVVARSNIAKKFNIRGQIDLIDYKFCPDGDYKWLLSYQDDATQYLSLRPLKNNSATEVTSELMKIFLTFGAPSILQLDNKHEFAAQITEELTAMWPECKVVARNTQIKGSKSDIESKLHSWMSENYSTKWSVGCYIVQYEINDSCHRLIGKSPYKTLFGCDPKTDFCKKNVPDLVISTIEADMEFKLEPKQEDSDDISDQCSDDDL